MAVDVRQDLSNVDRLHKELVDEVAGLPGVLQSFTPELLVDYLAATFKECDSESRSWNTIPFSASKEEGKWSTLEAMMMEGPSCSKAQEEAASMIAAAERIQATIRETERTSVTRVEDMGLPEGVEDEKGLILVRCKTCARVLLAGSCAAHEEHCRAAPAPFRPAASPAPSSTTASGKPAPARRKKAASVPKSKLGPGKKQAAAEAAKPLLCSMAARQPPQLTRPPLYPGPAKAPPPLLGQQHLLPPQHIAPRFSPDARNQPGSTSAAAASQAANSRRPAQLGQHGAAVNGGAPASQQMWASLQIPNSFLSGGLDDFGFGASLDWLDPGGALPPAPAAVSTAQPTAKTPPAKPAQAKSAAQGSQRQRPASNALGLFLPHPKRRRSAVPKRRLARMVTLPHVSAEEPGRTIPMPTPQKHIKRPVGNAHMAPQRYQAPSSNAPMTAPQQSTSQQQQQVAWRLAQSRAQQQQPSHHQAQRQSALRQPANQPHAGWQQQMQQQQQQHQQQQQALSHPMQGSASGAAPSSMGQSRSIVQQWASNGMQAMPPGSYLLPQQMTGAVSAGYLMQPQAQPSASSQKAFPQQPSAQHNPGAYQRLQQMQRQHYMQQAGRMVPVHEAQQRVVQSGQAALLNGPRVSMQRLVPDFMPISSMGCADGGSQHGAEASNPMKRSFSGDAGLLPSAKKLASLQQLHHTLPVLRRPEDFKPF